MPPRSHTRMCSGKHTNPEEYSLFINKSSCSTYESQLHFASFMTVMLVDPHLAKYVAYN